MAGKLKLIVLSQQLRGQSFDLTGDEYVLGRSDDADITIPDPTVSGRHCRLVRNDEASFKVVDNGSTNGTRVNGVRVEEGEEQALVKSDILQVGGVELLFDSEDTRTTGASTTQTVINLEETESGEVPVSDMKNFSPFGPRAGLDGREHKKVTLVIGALIGALVLAALVAIGILMLKLVT